MAENENCFNCVYSYWDPSQALSALSGGFPLRPACANHPDSPGRMRPLPSGRVCRNYRPRTATPQGDVKQIPLGEGLVAYVDAADFEWLNQWTWHCMAGYAARYSHRKAIYMHRQIMQTPEGMVVDHLNRNKLDNTRANLKNCTHRENACNRSKRRDTSSRFRGVGYHKNKWRVIIKLEGRPIYPGYFAEEIDAARAYDRAAVEYFGESARLNFPEEWPPERRQQIYSQQAAANRSVGATHASPSPRKGKSAEAGRRKTAAPGCGTGGKKNEGRKARRKEGKTDKAKRRTPAKRKTPAAKPRVTRAARRATKKPAAKRQMKSSGATGHASRDTTPRGKKEKQKK